MDIIGNWKARRLRKKQAKDLKKYREITNKIMSDQPEYRNAAYDQAQKAAKNTREKAMEKIKEGSRKRVKFGKIAAITGTALAGGYALKKLMDDEKMYSMILNEDQLLRLYSKLEDEDYLDEQEQRKKSVKHAKGLGTAAGSVLGALLGYSVGKNSKSGKVIGSSLGAVGGGTLGRAVGKSIKKSTEEDADKKIKTYKKASKHDKKYLREKNEREKARRLQERQARAMEDTAWHTSRWYR